MSDEQPFNFTTIVTTLATSLGTCVATIVGLAKYIENKYRSDLNKLQNEMIEVKQHVEDCEAKHLEASIKLARLEGKYEANNPTQS
jgi:hypothetical protein